MIGSVSDQLARQGDTASHLRDLSDMLDREPEGLIEEISPNDAMFDGNLAHYFRVGRSALKCVRLALLAAGKTEVRNILDLPCGHGRVLRTLKAAFPDANLTACDIDRDGVDFSAESFGAVPVYSEEDPAEIQIEGPFDLIWCGSLFTHLDEERWLQWLKRMYSLLAAEGLLVFTAHGRHTADALRQPDVFLTPAGKPRDYGIPEESIASLLGSYSETGFGFAAYRSSDRYGVSTSSPSWLASQLAACNLRLVNYIELGWDSHQDVVGCTRVDD
jgi:SAM-dependent methyltransferase